MRIPTPSSTIPDVTGVEPWWRYRMVWVVVAGPAVVIVACMATLALALLHPDPVVQDTASSAAQTDSLTPAIQARNHAAARR